MSGRLQLSRRGTVGFTYPQRKGVFSQSVSGRSLASVQEANIDAIGIQNLGLNTVNDMDGEGISGDFSTLIGAKVRKAFEGRDETFRPGFPGERHVILKLPNGKNGFANYMGPGTEVVKRVKRGDPGRTLSDKVAKRHDIDFTLATGAKSNEDQIRQVRSADQRMINSLQKIQKNGTDATRNVQIGLRGIQLKRLGQDLGIVSKRAFAGNRENLSAGDKVTLLSARKELEQEGLGELPGDALRTKLLKAMRKKKKTSDLKRHMVGGSLVIAGSSNGQSRGKDIGGPFKLNPKTLVGGSDHKETQGGFLGITIAMLIAAGIAAAQAAALGAAGATGALIVTKLAGGGMNGQGKITDLIKKTIKKTTVTVRDLSTKGKIALQKAFKDLKKGTTKKSISVAGKLLAPHFNKVIQDKLKKSLGSLGSGLSLGVLKRPGAKEPLFETAFVKSLSNKLPLLK